ncbi:MAG TPA: hypothetical protein DCF63_07530 [Planctomycetaceae bacterium]|nr:hypothetical protein [Planctomycetaceae bacterium]
MLILDEPTSGLDPAVRRSFLESMVDRAAAGQTVFLGSHQIHEVERIADWVAILHQGKVQIVAPLEDLKCNLTMLCFAQRDPLLALPASLAELDVLASTHSGRAGQWLVRGLDASLVDSLSSDPNLIDVKAYRPNLEELYLAFTQSCAVADQSFDSTALPRAV